MKPEMILQSNLLDIIFENRDKSYGAYLLRRDYPKRLKQSLLITFTLVFFTSLWLMNNGEGSRPMVTTFVLPPDVHLKATDPVKPPEVKPAMPKPAQPMAQVANPTYVIVPDNSADKKTNTIDDLEKGIIGIADVEGDDLTNGPPQLSAHGGDGNNSDVAVAKPEEPKEMAPLLVAEEMPEFPGGKDAFLKFMLRNLRQPDNMDAGEKVVVRVKFVVDVDGSIKSMQVMQSGGTLDAEVMRVVGKMPKWKPGKQNGRFVPVYFHLPVTFVGSE